MILITYFNRHGKQEGWEVYRIIMSLGVLFVFLTHEI